jgi:hypothetical protein
MGPTKLTLTSFQQRQLAPLFAEVRSGNAAGEQSAIMAQILPDGMILKLVSGKALVALMEALGVDPNREPQRSVKGH